MMHRRYQPMRTRAAGLAILALLVCTARSSAQHDESRQSLIVVRRHQASDAIRDYRRSLPEARPPLRGFRAMILATHKTSSMWHRRPADVVTGETPVPQVPLEPLDAAGAPWPFETTGSGDDPRFDRARQLVATHLAGDGLLVTLAGAIEVLGPEKFAGPAAGAPSQDQTNLLRSVGLPVDLLPFFRGLDGTGNAPPAIVGHIAKRLLAGATPATMRSELRRIPYHFSQTLSGFRVMTESGENQIGTVRLQLTRGTYWRGRGAGGNLDLARQLIEQLPNAKFIASIEEKHLDQFLKLASGWPLLRSGRLTVLPEPLPVAQWSQDNGKAGTVTATASSDGTAGAAAPVTIATLVPRYASRREDGSVFIPGESFLMDSLAATGHTVIQSPLLFQGGNLLAVRDPATGERLLLIGEAEVYRNTALGLTEAQVVESFRIELAVDRCIMMPAVSFHLDFDVCLRSHRGRMMAFVNDSNTASRIVLALGVKALARSGILNDSLAQELLNDLEARRPIPFLDRIGPVLSKQMNKQGRFSVPFARVFAVDEVDSPVGNLQRFLLAMDTFVHAHIRPTERQAEAYLSSFGRRAADREELNTLLSNLGWKVVGVPSLADGNRSINYLNGIHDRGHYYIPAYGGLFAPLDDAAAKVFRDELGTEIAVVPILCGESQRRVGAIHCSVNLYPLSQR